MRRGQGGALTSPLEPLPPIRPQGTERERENKREIFLILSTTYLHFLSSRNGDREYRTVWF